MRSFLILAVFCVAMPVQAQDMEKILKRDFKARGQATMDRVTPDALQRVCNETHDKPPVGKANRGDSIDFKDLLVNTRVQLGRPKGKPAAWDAGYVLYTVNQLHYQYEDPRTCIPPWWYYLLASDKIILAAQRTRLLASLVLARNERDVIGLLDHSPYEKLQTKVQAHEDEPKGRGQCTINQCAVDDDVNIPEPIMQNGDSKCKWDCQHRTHNEADHKRISQ